MMKKINIASQLIILFFATILVSSCIFILITVSYMTYDSEDDTFLKLRTELTLISNDDHDNINFKKINIAYISNFNGNEYKSENYNFYLTDNQLNDILDSIEEKIDDSTSFFNYENKKTIGDRTIYYSYETRGISDISGTRDYKIIITDDQQQRSYVKNMVVKLSITFFLIILLSISAIYIWSIKLTNRIKRIQNHILSLPKNNYDKSYIDDSEDEIGELSRALDKMRLDLQQNEKTKQEMLQNLSHDFKTPIAVIKSYAESINDGMADNNTANIIINEADKLTHKVKRLLQYNSLEYLEKNEEFYDVSMKELILEIVETFKFQTDIKFDLNLEDVNFKGYRENWYTVVDNIIDNAKRYAKTTIKIILKPNKLCIYNDGEHIDEKFINSEFKPYEKGSKGQFGLGMSIVSKTVDFFGMKLKVANEDVGVTFIISKD
ncbi:MAG: HAMP domain-containing histidine kinase [Acholeplasmatales bacterium]|nr:HAMP domain-containing histidine kinase [Acholeplasmatales bacterium]